MMSDPIISKNPQTDAGPTQVESQPPAQTEALEPVPGAVVIDATPGPVAELPTAQAPEEAPVAPSLSAEEVQELAARAAKAQENWDRYVRAVADLENFKKRAARERQEATKYANESLLSRLVPVLDTFDMALAAVNNPQGANVDSLKTGISMISTQLKSVLLEAGLEEIEAAGKPFDPNIHEAVSQQESVEVPEGHVMQQLRRGYRFRERLLRPATVIVARKPAEPEAQ